MASTTHLDLSAMRVELRVGGMTCASCASRISKRLNKIDGVEASVNYATELASVKVSGAEVSVEDLVARIEEVGFTAGLHERGGTDRILDAAVAEPAAAAFPARRLAFSLVLAVPVLVVSMVPASRFDGWRWVALALTAPVVGWGGWPFHRATWANLRHRGVTMDSLISLGTLAAFVWSLCVTVLAGTGEVYFDVAGTVTVFMLVGRQLEARAKRHAGSALRALLDLAPYDVSVMRDGTEIRVPVADLKVGELFVVRPGEKVATDGVVVDGASAVDVSLLTGESAPVDVAAGADVVGSSINSGGRLVVRATRVGERTALARMARLVTEAQSGKAPVQRLADRVAAVFVPAVMAVAAATFAGWLAFGGSASVALSAAVAVLIIACPCAVGLATPTALLVGTGRGAQLGILIRGPEILESTRKVDTVVLDKTGTVTTGVMSVVDMAVADGFSETELLRLAGSLESASEHPVGRAIVEAARRRGVALTGSPNFQALAGLGVRGSIGAHDVMVGREKLLSESGFRLASGMSAAARSAEELGRTVVFVGSDAEARGLLMVADTMKPSSATAISRLRELGLTPVLLTGDNEHVARAVAAELGIDEVFAGMLPEGKLRVVRDLQSRGNVVAMLGDGVNDAAALAQADLGIAMGGGTDVAIEASDITLVGDDPRAVVDAIRLSRRTLRVIKANLAWAFGYNVAAIPLAVAGVLNPLVAGAAMVASSLFVVSNSLRLRHFH